MKSIRDMLQMRNFLLGGGVIVAAFSLIACGGGSGGTGSCVISSSNVRVRLTLAFPDLIFNQPIELLQNPLTPGRWYVVERSGRVLTFTEGNATVSSVFVDISDKLATGGEGGLLGMAFHPDFFNNGEFFLSYTGPGQPLVSHIARYVSMDGGLTADPDTEQIVMSVNQPETNHNGGHLAFGVQDGYLYIGLGDGGGSGDPDGNGQNTDTLLGSLLRIDVDGVAPYGIPPDNPFGNSLGCGNGNNCPEIYAWGLRNPWRFSFDSDTGHLWLGDVGQSTREEIDRVENGANYGWNIVEGDLCFNDPICDTGGLSAPVAVYDRQAGVSVTGGYVYRGDDIPALVGEYLFGDFGSGRVWHLSADSQPASCPQLLLETDHSIVSFAQNDAGEIHVVDFSGGRIYRLMPDGP